MKEEEKPQNFVRLSLPQRIGYLWGAPSVERSGQRTESGGGDDWLRLDTDLCTFLSEVGSEETPASRRVIPGSTPGFNTTNLGISPRNNSPDAFCLGWEQQESCSFSDGVAFLPEE